MYIYDDYDACIWRGKKIDQLTDHISLPEDILHGGGPLPGDRLLTVGFEELPICCDELLKACGLVEVVVDEVHLEALDHHACIRGADATSSDDPNSLTLEQVANEPDCSNLFSNLGWSAALLVFYTPSVSNYKSFQEFWRVKLSQNLTKIIERNIKIYDIK